jgi:hypothetical protein
MKRPTHILTRDPDGTQVVVLQIEVDAQPGGQAAFRYELANRSKVERLSDTEFMVVQTGRLLTRTATTRRQG